MDVSQIDDVQALKALAYDQLILQQQIQRNLSLITTRLAELNTQASGETSSASPLEPKK